MELNFICFLEVTSYLCHVKCCRQVKCCSPEITSRINPLSQDNKRLFPLVAFFYYLQFRVCVCVSCFHCEQTAYSKSAYNLHSARTQINTIYKKPETKVVKRRNAEVFSLLMCFFTSANWTCHLHQFFL